jgi:hypothetical protein
MKLYITHPTDEEVVLDNIAIDERPEGTLYYSLDVPHCRTGSRVRLTDNGDRDVGPEQLSDGLAAYILPTREGQTRTLAQRYVGMMFAICIATLLVTGTGCLCYAMIAQTILKYATI